MLTLISQFSWTFTEIQFLVILYSTFILWTHNLTSLKMHMASTFSLEISVNFASCSLIPMISTDLINISICSWSFHLLTRPSAEIAGSRINALLETSFGLCPWDSVMIFKGMLHLTLRKKATIHQVTTMLANSKNVLFPGHNHLLTTSSDDPLL